MKRIFCFLMLAVAVAGCRHSVSVDGGTMLTSGETRQVNFTNGASPSVTAQMNMKGLLNVSVSHFGEGNDAAKLSDAVASSVKGGIAADVARLVDENGDVSLRITVGVEQIDADLEYKRYEAAVRLELRRAKDNRLLGMKTLGFRGKRKMGNAALSQFVGPASEQTLAWVQETLRKVADEELGVAVIRFSIPCPSNPTPEWEAYYVSAIGRTLASMEKVLSAECISQSFKESKCEYRLLYLKSAYPQGIINEVVRKVSSIPEPR